MNKKLLVDYIPFDISRKQINESMSDAERIRIINIIETVARSLGLLFLFCFLFKYLIRIC